MVVLNVSGASPCKLRLSKLRRKALAQSRQAAASYERCASRASVLEKVLDESTKREEHLLAELTRVRKQIAKKLKREVGLSSRQVDERNARLVRAGAVELADLPPKDLVPKVGEGRSLKALNREQRMVLNSRWVSLIDEKAKQDERALEAERQQRAAVVLEQKSMLDKQCEMRRKAKEEEERRKVQERKELARDFENWKKQEEVQADETRNKLRGYREQMDIILQIERINKAREQEKELQEDRQYAERSRQEAAREAEQKRQARAKLMGTWREHQEKMQAAPTLRELVREKQATKEVMKWNTSGSEDYYKIIEKRIACRDMLEGRATPMFRTLAERDKEKEEIVHKRWKEHMTAEEEDNQKRREAIIQRNVDTKRALDRQMEEKAAQERAEREREEALARSLDERRRAEDEAERRRQQKKEIEKRKHLQLLRILSDHEKTRTMRGVQVKL